MKNENFSSFSFLLKFENDFSNPSFKIHFSYFRINENEHFSFFFFEVLIFQVSKKFKIEIFKFIQFHFQNKNENLNAFTNSIFVVR